MKKSLCAIIICLVNAGIFGQTISSYTTIFPPNDSFSTSTYIVGKNSLNQQKEVAAEFNTDSLTVSMPLYAVRLPFSGILGGRYQLELWSQNGNAPNSLINGSEAVFEVSTSGTNILTIIADTNNIILQPNTSYYLVLKGADGTSGGNWNFSVYNSLVNGTFLQTDGMGFTPYNNVIPAFEIIVGTAVISKTIGIKSPKTMATIYPNPVQDILTIQSKKMLERLTVVDLNGKILLSKEVTSDNEFIEIKQLPSGLYWLKLEDREGEISSRKFIKK